jgi:hypothetical protein
MMVPSDKHTYCISLETNSKLTRKNQVFIGVGFWHQEAAKGGSLPLPLKGEEGHPKKQSSETPHAHTLR